MLKSRNTKKQLSARFDGHVPSGCLLLANKNLSLSLSLSLTKRRKQFFNEYSTPDTELTAIRVQGYQL